MHSFECLRTGDTLQHETLEGKFEVEHTTPAVLRRTMKILLSDENWYMKGPNGVMLSVSNAKRGDTLKSTKHQGEFVVNLIAGGMILATEMRLVTDPKGWWVV